MKMWRLVGLYRLLFGVRDVWVTGVTLIVFGCAGYLTLNFANFVGVVKAPETGNWALVIGFNAVLVLVAVVLNRRSDSARSH